MNKKNVFHLKYTNSLLKKKHIIIKIELSSIIFKQSTVTLVSQLPHTLMHTTPLIPVSPLTGIIQQKVTI